MLNPTVSLSAVVPDVPALANLECVVMSLACKSRFLAQRTPNVLIAIRVIKSYASLHS